MRFRFKQRVRIRKDLIGFLPGQEYLAKYCGREGVIVHILPEYELYQLDTLPTEVFVRGSALEPLIDPKAQEFIENLQRPNPGLLYETPALLTAAQVIERMKK